MGRHRKITPPEGWSWDDDGDLVGPGTSVEILHGTLPEEEDELIVRRRCDSTGVSVAVSLDAAIAVLESHGYLVEHDPDGSRRESLVLGAQQREVDAVTRFAVIASGLAMSDLPDETRGACLRSLHAQAHIRAQSDDGGAVERLREALEDALALFVRDGLRNAELWARACIDAVDHIDRNEVGE